MLPVLYMVGMENMLPCEVRTLQTLGEVAANVERSWLFRTCSEVEAYFEPSYYKPVVKLKRTLSKVTMNL